MTDSTLIAGLFASHAAGLSLYARQFLGASDADDAVHDAFVSLIALRHTPTDPQAWLYRTVRNGAIDRSRSGWRRKRRESAVAGDRREWFETRADDLIDSKRVTQVLEMLPRDVREVIVLRIWAGLGFQQIGDTIGCSVSTAHERYRAALEIVRTRLEQNDVRPD